MSRALRVVDAENIDTLARALRDALTGDGPAVLPRAADAPPTAAAAPIPETVAQNVAVVIETSGSTGVPKRVALSRDALLASAAASAGALGGSGQWLLALPAHYIAGVQVLVRSITAGTDPVLMSPTHFEPAEFVRHARMLRADQRYVSLVPVQLARLLGAARHPETLAVLRRFDGILVGGQALRSDLRERAEELGLPLTRTYGSSETCGGCVYNGMPVGGVRARVSGSQLELSGPVLAEGYLGDPARTEAVFHIDQGIRWYRTGDLGEIDAGGRVSVLGRSDNVIISGGEKVLLDAVERRVRELDGQRDAVVVTVDDAEWGQVPVVVTLRAVPLVDVREHVAVALGRASAPQRVVLVDAIPQLASGKPDRVALRRLVSHNA